MAHLENRVAAAKTLGAREEFKIYLSMYVKRIGAEGLKGKIEELLRSLSDDLIAEDEEDGRVKEKADDTICGWKKEELLKEAVLILGKLDSLIIRNCSTNASPGKHRDLQRITVPYARLLGIVHENQQQDEAMVTDL